MGVSDISDGVYNKSSFRAHEGPKTFLLCVSVLRNNTNINMAYFQSHLRTV